jgi:hypothetical protein
MSTTQASYANRSLWIELIAITNELEFLFWIAQGESFDKKMLRT